MSTEPNSEQRDYRWEAIRDIRRLADWLETHPEAPFGANTCTSGGYFQHDVQGSPAEMRAEWQRLVDELGATAENWSREGHLAASVKFGRSEYMISAIWTSERPSTVDADAAQILAATRPDQPVDIPGTLQAFANMARKADEDGDGE